MWYCCSQHILKLIATLILTLLLNSQENITYGTGE